MKNSWIYLLIVFALFLGINAPSLFSEGMFMDGLIYSTISRNLAEGKGSFWNLFFSTTYFTHFYEHPPLAIGLESILFSVFGDTIYIERFYSLLTIIISGFILVKTWKELVQKELQSFYWLPLLILTTVGVVGWSMANNMLENTMLVFVLLSFYFAIISLSEEKQWRQITFILLAGFSLFLGFMSKGFVALFPLSTLFYFGLFTKEISFLRGVRDSALMLIGLLFPFAVLYLFVPEGIDSLTIYFHNQVENSIKNVSTVSSRFWIVGSLIQQLIPAFVLVVITLVTAGKVKRYYFSKKAIAILAVGLSGVLPILISLKQRDFYIIGAYPFFAIVLAMFMAPLLKNTLSKLEEKAKFKNGLKVFSFALLFVSLTITFFQFGRTGRDKSLVNDVKKISKLIQPNSILFTSSELASDWALKGYFARYSSIGLSTDRDLKSDYLIKEKQIKEEGFTEVNGLKLEQLVLYKVDVVK